MKYKYSLTDTYFLDIREYFIVMISSLPKTKPNRSLIGKKAYKTFLKNGGYKDSEGKFRKKSEIDWEWSCGNEMCVSVHSSPKIQVDWEKLGDEAFSQNWNGGSVAVAKVFAKVFKDYGLLKEGVEI